MSVHQKLEKLGLETTPVSLRLENSMVYKPGNRMESSSLSRETSFSSTELSVSRNSSFSSFSSHTTGTGSSDCFETDSSVSRSSSTRSVGDLASGLLLSAGKLSDGPSNRRISLLKERNKTMQRSQGVGATQNRPTILKRSSWESGTPVTRLSSPQGLMISTATKSSVDSGYLTPPEPRLRSKSESYSEKPKDIPKQNKALGRNDKIERGVMNSSSNSRRAVTSVCMDEEEVKRCLLYLEGCNEISEGLKPKPPKPKKKSSRIAELEEQVKTLIEERNKARAKFEESNHERDRIKRERDALELERGMLLRDKEELQNELANRCNVIGHLQEHLAMALIPVSPTNLSVDPPELNTKEYKTSPKILRSLDMPVKAVHNVRPRSKSEIRSPEFFFPDRNSKPDTYTCL